MEKMEMLETLGELSHYLEKARAVAMKLTMNMYDITEYETDDEKLVALLSELETKLDELPTVDHYHSINTLVHRLTELIEKQ